MFCKYGAFQLRCSSRISLACARAYNVLDTEGIKDIINVGIRKASLWGEVNVVNGTHKSLRKPDFLCSPFRIHTTQKQVV